MAVVHQNRAGLRKYIKGVVRWGAPWSRAAEGAAFRLGAGLGAPAAAGVVLRGNTGLVPDEFMPFLDVLLKLAASAIAIFAALDLLGCFRNRWDKPRWTRSLVMSGSTVLMFYGLRASGLA